MSRSTNTRLHTILAADLGLGNNKLARVGIVGTGKRMLENANSAQNVANNLGLAGEVRGVTKNGLGTSLKGHLLDTSHGSLDTNGAVALVDQLINVGVEHVGTAINGRETSKALRQLAKAIERVDVRRLAVASDRVAVHADTLNGGRGLAAGCAVFISEVKSHCVANKVLGASLEAKLVVDVVHGAGVHVETWIPR